MGLEWLARRAGSKLGGDAHNVATCERSGMLELSWPVHVLCGWWRSHEGLLEGLCGTGCVYSAEVAWK